MRFSLACFNGRRPQSEKKVPFKVLKPLELNNRVSQKGSDVSGMIYIHIYVLMIFYDNFIITYYFYR